MNDDLIRWLTEERKISKSVLDSLGVEQVDHASLGPAVAFHYRRGGEVYATKFRTIDKQFRSSKGVQRGLYNEDGLRGFPELPIVITEGEIDALSCIEAGFDRSVSLPSGWQAQNNPNEVLVAEEETLRASPYVIVASDSDAAGESLPRAVANLLRHHDVRHATWPEGCKDPNDVLVRHGAAALEQCLLDARRIDPPGGLITGFSDLPPLSERRVLRTGLQPFDKVVALELGAISVCTGVPGAGKSTFLIWMADNVSVHEGIRVGMFPFETHPYAVRDQLSLIRTGCDFASLDGPAQTQLEAELDRRFRLVHRRVDENTTHEFGWLEDMIQTLAIRDGCKLIVLDPWNELEHLPEPGETMTTYINWATKRLRQIAEALEVHIVIAAHPRKMLDSDRPPTGYDVADSSAFFNKPSLGVTVHQRKGDDGEEWVDLIVWKVRDTRLYGFGRHTTSVWFDRPRQRYVPRQRNAEHEVIRQRTIA